MWPVCKKAKRHHLTSFPHPHAITKSRGESGLDLSLGGLTVERRDGLDVSAVLVDDSSWEGINAESGLYCVSVDVSEWLRADANLEVWGGGGVDSVGVSGSSVLVRVPAKIR